MSKRIIEFRGKTKDNNKWIFGNLIYHYSRLSNFSLVAPHIQFYDVNNNYNVWEVIPESIGQFTGQFGTVKGIKNKKIYEGDIQREEIEFDGGDERIYYVCRYMPELAAFVWMTYGDTCVDWATSKEEFPYSLNIGESYIISTNEFDCPDWWKKD